MLAAALFASGKSHDYVTIRLVAFLLVENEIRNPAGSLSLIVYGAASIEVAVLFGEMERVETPVASQRFNNIEMCEKQYGFFRACSAIPDYQILKMGVDAVYVNVFVGKTGVFQALRHR